MTRNQIIQEERKMKKITERFGGEVFINEQRIKFDNPIVIKTRADALDILFLLHRCDDWIVEQDEPLEGLYQFIKKLPKEKT